MRRLLIPLALLASPLAAQLPPPKPGDVPSPPEIVAQAPKSDWMAIAQSDLLVMDLAPDAKARPRRVVIQLMPPPFSQGWIGNIRKLAAARFWDGTSVNRVQDNYVVQWGDAETENKAKAKALPAGLGEMTESEYSAPIERIHPATQKRVVGEFISVEKIIEEVEGAAKAPLIADSYSKSGMHWSGWPLAGDFEHYWPVHCYGMVGVGRDMPPDAGSGAELYTVIGHAPRHLDRNIALVGRVIEGIEHLSSLPRGHGALGFYDLAQGDERVPILSVRIGNEVKDLPAYEYLSTESASFAKYADARANRRDPFFIRPAGGADICNIPVPVRRVK